MLKKSRPNRPPSGRPPLPVDLKMRRGFFYGTDADWEKVARNGGKAWIRELIRSAPEVKK